MTDRTSNNRFALLTFVIFLVVWTSLAIRPSYRHNWLLESVLVFVGVPMVVLMHWFLLLSRILYLLMYLFMCLHAVRARYTYADVPYDRSSNT